MGKQRKIKRFKFKSIVNQIEKLNNDLGGVCTAKYNGTSKYGIFFRLAIISEGKETWWLFLLIATKKSLNFLNI